MGKMKITAGLGSIDEYIPYLRAGAEELFCGFVPASWADRYGAVFPMNRREVLYYNVQIGAESELRILGKMKERYQVPVTITLNALSYLSEQYPLLAEYMLRCKALGFDRFIIADHGLLVYLKKQGLSKEFVIHVSGELGEMNTGVIEECRSLGADRIIFHRKVTLEAMAQMKAAYPDLEYEAFAMNEKCHFHGGFCNSLHCDELTHMCLVPYRLEHGTEPLQEEAEQPDIYIPGYSGCGLCALPELQMAGVTWLKVVSRGGRVDETAEDIRALKRAVELLEEVEMAGGSAEEYSRRMKQELFPAGCGKNCYYRSESKK